MGILFFLWVIIEMDLLYNHNWSWGLLDNILYCGDPTFSICLGNLLTVGLRDLYKTRHGGVTL